ncbi:hypothetical protein HDV05_007442, partial [Chytridiales sp. JEL 0842]
MVSSYLSTALYAAEAAIMVSSPRNVHTVQLLLETQGINVAWAIKSGQLTMIDGYSHISELIEGGSITSKAFNRLFGTTINELLEKWPQVCIYGDIVSGMVFDSLRPNSTRLLGDMAIELETIYHKFQADKPNLVSMCGYWMEAFTSGEFAVDSAFVERFREVCKCHDHCGTEANPVWDTHFKSEAVRRKEEQLILESYMMDEAMKKRDCDRYHDKPDSAPFLSRLQSINRATSSRTNVTKGPVIHVDGGGPGTVTDIQKCIISPTDPARLVNVLEKRADALQAELNIFKMKEASFTDAMSILARSATESLQRERDVHNQILSVLPVGVLCAESWREQQMYVNKTFCDMVECSAGDVMSGNWLQVIHPEDRGKVQELLINIGEMCDHQEPVKLEYRILSSKSRGDCHVPPCAETAASAAKEDTQQYKHEEEDLVWVTSETVKCNIKGRWVFVHAIVDTTEVKRVSAERTLFSAREAYQMQKAADADKRRLLLDEFIDGLCHELRNPLNGIVGNLDVLQTSLDDRKKLLTAVQHRSECCESSPDGKITITKEELIELIFQIEDEEASIATINTCAIHSRVLADDVLALSKLDCKKMCLRNSSFCPKSLLGEVAKIMGPKASAKGLDVRFNVPFTSTPFIADAFRIRQVIINLFSNAVVYAEEGSITLGLEYVQLPPNNAGPPSESTSVPQQVSKRLNNSVSSSNSRPGTPRGSRSAGSKDGYVNFLRISVTDTGVGMTQDEMDHLFQKFSQPTAAVSREQQYGGSGLGLVISKKLVELMGGWIEIESVKGVGSTFSFTIREGKLPKENPKSPELQPSISVASKPARTGSVGIEEGPAVSNMANLPMDTPDGPNVAGSVPLKPAESILI